MADSFPTLLERLYLERFTGTVLLHFMGGSPLEIEFPGASRRIRLDKPLTDATGLTATVDSRPVSRGSAGDA